MLSQCVFYYEYYLISYSSFTVIVAVLCLELVSKAPSYSSMKRINKIQRSESYSITRLGRDFLKKIG